MKNIESNLPHQDLIIAQELAYKPSGLNYKNLIKDVESKEYGASTLEINNRRIKFRIGKITPTKIGQFVTLWKRSGNEAIRPYDLNDPIDLFVISVRNEKYFGQFVFPKLALFEKGFVSNKGAGGKRAMRIYPPWDKPDSLQAKKTQSWQLAYFFEIDPQKAIDLCKIRKLFGSETDSILSPSPEFFQ